MCVARGELAQSRLFLYSRPASTIAVQKLLSPSALRVTLRESKRPAVLEPEGGADEVSGAPAVTHPAHTGPLSRSAPRRAPPRPGGRHGRARTHPRRAAGQGRGSLRGSDRCGRREGARSSHACPAARPSASGEASSASSRRVRPPRLPGPARPASALGKAARARARPRPPHTARAHSARRPPRAAAGPRGPAQVGSRGAAALCGPGLSAPVSAVLVEGPPCPGPTRLHP